MRNVTLPCTRFAYSSGGYLNGSSTFCITGSESGAALDCSASIIFFASFLSMHPLAVTANAMAVSPTMTRDVAEPRASTSHIALTFTAYAIDETSELLERLERRHGVDV